jgi:hypothetical protein
LRTLWDENVDLFKVKVRDDILWVDLSYFCQANFVNFRSLSTRFGSGFAEANIKLEVDYQVPEANVIMAMTYFLGAGFTKGEFARCKHVLAAIINCTRCEDLGCNDSLHLLDEVHVEASRKGFLRRSNDYVGKR